MQQQTRGLTASSSSRGGATIKGATLPSTTKVLNKQEVLQLRKYQRGLKDLENERTNGLIEQIAQMKEAFLLAQRKREYLANLYKERREDVLRQLAEMRTEIETTFARLHKELKDFAADWMATKEDAVQEWLDTLEERSQEIEESFRNLRVKNSEVDAAIETERVERRTQIDDAAEKVQGRLDEIRQGLAETKTERLAEQARYEDSFQTHFSRLHRTLARETEERQEQCSADIKRCLDFYTMLHEKEDVLEDETRHVYRELNLDLQVEEAERKAAQQKMVREAQSFLDQFRTDMQFDIGKIYERNNIRRKFITDRTEGKF
ncbi:unnamed protein product [Amoebophrya sp. A25]|nr:unnamed protein product [Amoebophrya sp. A25]|eukprot:GSA25T00000148001.1